jgi:hypothetical protein
MDVASVGGRGSKESERFSGCMLCVCVCVYVCVCACLLQRVTVHWVYVPQDASYQHETSQTFLLNHPVARLAPVNELLAFHLWCLCVCWCGCVRPRPNVCACMCGVCVRHHALAREPIYLPFTSVRSVLYTHGEGACLRRRLSAWRCATHTHTHTHTWEEIF